MRGIILAGGLSSRLLPITSLFSKQLLPIYDKPMIYYPLSTLMLAGIKDILIITTPDDNSKFRDLLKDGSHLGINIEFLIQTKPRGLADSFIISEKFIGHDSVCLILGDNLFYGHGFSDMLVNVATNTKDKATVFGYYVSDPERFGVVEFDDNKNVISIEEKPKSPKSNFAVVGLYFYPNSVIEIAKNIQPSARGELEITDVNKEYLNSDKLSVEILGRGFAWLDTGTFGSMSSAANFIKTIEERQGLKIGCIEEVAYRMRYIDKKQLDKLAQPLLKSGYGDYLLRIK